MAIGEPKRRFARWPDARFDRLKAQRSEKGKTCLIIQTYAHIQFGQTLTDVFRQCLADSAMAVALIYNQEGMTQSTARNSEQSDYVLPVHGKSDTGFLFGKHLGGQAREPFDCVLGDAPLPFLTGKSHQGCLRFGQCLWRQEYVFQRFYHGDYPAAASRPFCNRDTY